MKHEIRFSSVVLLKSGQYVRVNSIDNTDNTLDFVDDFDHLHLISQDEIESVFSY